MILKPVPMHFDLKEIKKLLGAKLLMKELVGLVIVPAHVSDKKMVFHGVLLA